MIDATATAHNFRARLTEALSAWVPMRQSLLPGAGLDRARESLALIGESLARLGDRHGVREDAAREWLISKQQAIVGAVAVFDSIGGDLGGSRATALFDRIRDLGAEAAAVDRAFADATHETIRSVRDREDHLRIDVRDLIRDLGEVIDQLRLPAFPAAASFERAQHATEALERLPGVRPRPSQIAAAIQEGLGLALAADVVAAQADLRALDAAAAQLDEQVAADEAAAPRPDHIFATFAREKAEHEADARAKAAAASRAEIAEQRRRAGLILGSVFADERRLWIVYESAPAHELVKWRARAAAE